MSGTGLTAASPYLLLNDQVRTCTIKITDAAGATVPMPPGDVDYVICSEPGELNAVIGTDADGNAALVVNALVTGGSTIYTTTVVDINGLMPAVDFWQITDDKTATNITVDISGSTFIAQPVPGMPPATP